MKNRVHLVISIFLLVLGVFVTIIFYRRYCDLDETIQEGEAYGFKIGDNKTTTFWRIAEMFAHQQVRWFTVPEEKQFRQLRDVADEFSDWEYWNLRIPGGKEILLWFTNHSLSYLYEFHGYGKKNTLLSSWPQNEEDIPRLKPEMSYEEVYKTLLELSSFETYQSMQLKPEGFRDVTIFTEEELNRLKRHNKWYVHLYPFPGSYKWNYLYFHFERGKLIELQRRKDAPDFLDDIVDIIFGFLSYLRE